MTEEQIRAIVREEIAKAMAEQTFSVKVKAMEFFDRSPPLAATVKFR